MGIYSATNMKQQSTLNTVYTQSLIILLLWMYCVYLR